MAATVYYVNLTTFVITNIKDFGMVYEVCFQMAFVVTLGLNDVVVTHYFVEMKR